MHFRFSSDFMSNVMSRKLLRGVLPSPKIHKITEMVHGAKVAPCTIAPCTMIWKIGKSRSVFVVLWVVLSLVSETVLGPLQESQ